MKLDETQYIGELRIAECIKRGPQISLSTAKRRVSEVTERPPFNFALKPARSRARRGSMANENMSRRRKAAGMNGMACAFQSEHRMIFPV